MAGTTGLYRPETSKLGLGFGVPGMALHLSGKVSSHVTFATNVTTDLCFSKKKKKPCSNQASLLLHHMLLRLMIRVFDRWPTEIPHGAWLLLAGHCRSRSANLNRSER
jgi:hypothetical protein